jgi:streptogramin lyase
MSDRGAVSRIDPATNTVQQTIPTPGGPSALTVGGGFVWVADTLAGAVSRIDPRTNGGQVVGRPIRVGNAPSGIAYGLGAVWAANSVDRTVIRIDPVTGAPGRPISVEDGADGVAVGDGSVRVIGQSAGVLSRIDPEARTVVGTTSVGNEPGAVAVGPDAVWVANGADDTVAKIDPSSGRLKGDFLIGKQPSGIAVAADGHVWVASAGSATLTELDPATGHVIRTVPTGAVPGGGVALDGETAYVAAQVPPSAHRGGTLTLAVANPPAIYAQPIPKELDPASGYSAWELLTLTNDGLLGYSQAGGSETYKVVADLATGLPTVSDGGLTYTFQLRKGIRYSTGGVVQPADIRRGIERALLESGGQFPKLSPYLAVIEGGGGCLTGEHCNLTRGITTSPGSSTVTFHLSKPDPDFLFKLALPDYDAVPASTPVHARLPLPATGPYKISGYQKKGVVELVRNPRFHVWSTEAQPDGYPDRIVERFNYTGPSAIRAVERGTVDITANGPDSDLAARPRSITPDAVLEPALRRAAADDPRALAEHEGRAVQRRPRPASVQPRSRPQPARPDQRRRGGVPVPPAERKRLQLLLPVQRAQPQEGSPARRRVRHQGAAGHDLDLRHPGRAPEQRVPGLGPAKHRLQGSGRVRSA